MVNCNSALGRRHTYVPLSLEATQAYDLQVPNQMMRHFESLRQGFVSQLVSIAFCLALTLLCVQGFAGKYGDSRISRSVYEIPEHDYPVVILDPQFDAAFRHTGIPSALGEIELTYAKSVDPPELVPTVDAGRKRVAEQSTVKQITARKVDAEHDNSVYHVFADVLNDLGIAVESRPLETTIEASTNSETTVEVPLIRSPSSPDGGGRDELNQVIQSLIEDSKSTAKVVGAPKKEVKTPAEVSDGDSPVKEVQNDPPQLVDKTLKKADPPTKEKQSNPPQLADKPLKSTDPESNNTQPTPSIRDTVVYTPQFVARNQRIRWLKQRIEQCLTVYRRQFLNTGENGCWSTMHAILGVGQQARIQVHNRRGATQNALQWLCENQPCARRQLFYLKDNGEIGVREGPGYQGHPAQFLAIAAQIQVPRSQRMVIGGRHFTLQDLIEAEKNSCRHGTELTFKLIGLMHYLESDEKWTNSAGETWDLPTLIAAELSEQVNGAACGGTHRIMAVSHAALKRQFRKEPMTGQWWRAQKYMRDYQRYTLSLQNRNGSFSSEWFKKRAANDEKDRQIQTTGHILEWLVFSLNTSELSDPKITHSVMFLTNLMIENRFYDWEQGPKWHAVRALDLYYRRAFGTELPNNLPLAQQLPERNQRMGIFSRIKGHLK